MRLRISGLAKNFWWALLVLAVYLCFYGKSLLYLDPDFGWHLRTGQLIAAGNLPRIDPFSYTMPNYPYVDHSWLTDFGIAKVFSLIGMPGLAFLTALIILAAVFVISSHKIPLFLALGILFSFASIRPLDISWLLFSVLIWLVFHKEAYQKWRWTIPFLFFLWANLHGGFFAGLLVLLFVDPLVFLISLIATLLNPYGFGLWREIWSTISDVSLHSTISEWQPNFFWLNPAFIFLLVLSVTSVLFFWRKYSPTHLLLYFIFLFFAATAIRNIPFWMFIAVAMTNYGLIYFGDTVKNNHLAKHRYQVAQKIILALSLIIFFLSVIFVFSDRSILVDSRFYPRDAVTYLSKNPPAGNVFSEYGWGGYLIWKLPEKKVFVDGRMPSWQQNSYSAFREYSQVAKGEINYQSVFARYQIDTVLSSIPSQRPDLFSFLQEKVNRLLNIQPKNIDLTERLEKDSWQKIYQDQTAVIYQKPVLQ